MGMLSRPAGANGVIPDVGQGALGIAPIFIGSGPDHYPAKTTMTHIYHVTARPDGQWQGSKPDTVMPLFLAHTQLEAEEIMCEIALAMGHAHVLVFDPWGTLLRDRAFGATDKTSVPHKRARRPVVG